jgi:RNA polymerase subunit RPABC4/transcription elongation factor Spt4
MRRCTACFRYYPGQPQFCPNCGRSFTVRICNRGHINPRQVHYCLTCGSSELSTPAPPESLLAVLSRWVLIAAISLFAGIVAMTLTVAAIQAIDWRPIVDRLVLLGIVLGFLYWTTTLLPGPVRKVGKAAGRGLWKVAKGKRDKR